MATGPRRGSARAAGTGRCLRGATSCSASGRADGTGCACCRSPRWVRPGPWWTRPSRTARSSSPRTPTSPRPRSRSATSRTCSLLSGPTSTSGPAGAPSGTGSRRPDTTRTATSAERRTFAAPDGTEVPVTLVRHRDTPLDGTAPALLYGYGAYEYTFEPDWDPALPSLLDRGVVFAHAHVRGGGEGGRRWWLDGRLAPEAEHVHRPPRGGRRAGRPGGRPPARVARAQRRRPAPGRGALSQRPDRWAAVVAEVPFVDVVTTMFDASVPLTVTEWDEWGDPRRRAEFDWLLGYSPYDNLPVPGTRPDLLVTGGPARPPGPGHRARQVGGGAA